MDTSQTLYIVGAIGLGIFFFCLGILFMTNVKIQNLFVKWWYPTAETEAEKKKKRNYIRFVDGTLMILFGFLLIFGSLGMFIF